MVGIGSRKGFHTEIVNTEAKFCRTSVVLPETRGAGARVAAARRKLIEKVLAGKNCSLFQSTHSFFDSDVNATIRADEMIEIVLFASGKYLYLIRMNSLFFIGEARK
jgi:hypothetical protein